MHRDRYVSEFGWAPDDKSWTLQTAPIGWFALHGAEPNELVLDRTQRLSQGWEQSLAILNAVSLYGDETRAVAELTGLPGVADRMPAALGSLRTHFSARTDVQTFAMAVESGALFVREQGTTLTIQQSQMRIISGLARGKTLAEIRNLEGMQERAFRNRYWDLAEQLGSPLAPMPLLRSAYSYGARNLVCREAQHGVAFSLRSGEEPRFGRDQAQALVDRSNGLSSADAAALRRTEDYRQTNLLRGVIKNFHARNSVEAVCKAIVLDVPALELRPRTARLTPRQVYALARVAGGCTLGQAGLGLGIGETHMKALFRREILPALGAENREQAVRNAFEAGIFMVDRRYHPAIDSQ